MFNELNSLQSIFDYVIEMRRYFHMNPELGLEEFNTQKKIISELENLGLNPQKIGKTGVVCDIEGNGSKRLAIRADIDALPIDDQIDKPYRSRVPNVCHACGHDGHIAMLLGLARFFSENIILLSGKLRLIFQPNEEKVPIGGAKRLIEEGVLNDVDIIIGAHLWQPIECGKIGISYDRMMACADEFVIKISGRGGHGSMPHQTIDPIITGSQIILALKMITSTNIDPLENAVLSIGLFNAGSAFNIIPDSSVIKGTVRTFSQEVRETMFRRIREVCEGICASNGAKFDLEPIFGYPSLINHKDIAKIIESSAIEVLGEENVQHIKPVMGAEDFSYYLQKIKGAFFFIGAGNVSKGIIYPHHHPHFDIDENALKIGLKVFINSTIKILK
ncbi:amidohydrolase [Thermodesulfobium narugense DSM 14796]|uniref:Amidohydrolase n=1 Tax=Thermodesulfobium narugense DSM 14796 TaxID=747365 RepID=M1E8L0_9BACT|nr:amidohydrolase [Thermodesulfobium narugense]AEE14539.1 amidohydrolase [Thermodesulfobium narugense DSM 14796]